MNVMMVVDADSMDSMKHVGDKMGVVITVEAHAGSKYSHRGRESTSLVPKGCSYISINAGDKIHTFWDLVAKEKTKRRAAYLLLHPIQPVQHQHHK